MGRLISSCGLSLRKTVIMLGALYGIGVGPGDPELRTLKAVMVIREVSHVSAVSSSKNGCSFADRIVGEHMPPGVALINCPFP